MIVFTLAVLRSGSGAHDVVCQAFNSTGPSRLSECDAFSVLLCLSAALPPHPCPRLCYAIYKRKQTW